MEHARSRHFVKVWRVSSYAHEVSRLIHARGMSPSSGHVSVRCMRCSSQESCAGQMFQLTILFGRYHYAPVGGRLMAKCG